MAAILFLCCRCNKLLLRANICNVVQCKQFQLSNEMSFRKSETVLRILLCPSDEQVARLHLLYPHPHQIIDDIYGPLIKSDKNNIPVLTNSSYLDGRCWRASLSMIWPQKMCIRSTRYREHQAERAAYLQTCSLLQMIGLIYCNNDRLVAMDMNQALRSLEDVSQTYCGTKHFEIVSSLPCESREGDWLTTVRVSWPIQILVQGNGATLELSQYNACLRTCVKMKVLGLFTSTNIINEIKLAVVKKWAPLPDLTRTEDFEIFVDASSCGFGAYLVQDEKTVYWFTEQLPESAETDDKFNSAFFEFYALVAAVYTWKHKFVNKKVICWTDNEYASQIVNSGHLLAPKVPPLFEKLFSVLRVTSKKYGIVLSANHISRQYNRAADHLSRKNVEKFREIMPNAYFKAKKTKQLKFSLPLCSGGQFQFPKNQTSHRQSKNCRNSSSSPTDDAS